MIEDRVVKIIKKNGDVEDYIDQKVINACEKSAHRALVKLTEEDYSNICNRVLELISENDYYVEDLEYDLISVEDMHLIVEKALNEISPLAGRAYGEYRNYKTEFVRMLDDVYKKAQTIMYLGDVSNANTDSALVSTKRSLIYNELNKELYQKFNLTKEELQACKDGYIYIHDMSARRDTMNCCLFDVKSVLSGGFEMGNVWYNEPKSLDVAFDVIGDIVMSSASQQYGGFTIPEVDKILEPYAEKSYQKHLNKYLTRCYLSEEGAEQLALEDVEYEFKQGFQGWEYKFNTVASSRGDYPFIAMSFGIATSKWGRMASKMALEVRKNGQGKEGFKKPVLFPKLTFLYDENLHGDGSDKYVNGDIFENGIDCSCATMYPDWLSLTGEGYIPTMYKKYGKVVSLMG